MTGNKRVKWIRRAAAHARRPRAAARRVSRPRADRPLPPARRPGKRGRSSRRRKPIAELAADSDHAARAAREAEPRARGARLRARLAGAARPARASRRTAGSIATRWCWCSRRAYRDRLERTPGGSRSSAAFRTRGTSTSTRRGLRSATSRSDGFDARLGAAVGVQHARLVQRSAAAHHAARGFARRSPTPSSTSSRTTRSTRRAARCSTRASPTSWARAGRSDSFARAARTPPRRVVAARLEDEKVLGRFWAQSLRARRLGLRGAPGRRAAAGRRTHRGARLDLC